MQKGPNSSNADGWGAPDEALLLAWVEGEPLTPEATAAVSKAMAADAALARRLELMRADCMALRFLAADEAAPAGLIEGVENALQPVMERELLLGLREGEPAESVPVVSMVRPKKQGLLQTFLADRAGRRMALAASLLVLVGGATWWGTVMLYRGTQPVGPVAINSTKPEALLAPEGPADAGSIALKASPSGESRPDESRPDEGMAIAQGDVSARAPGVEALMSAPEGTAAVEASAAPMTLAAAEMTGPVRTPMDAALAAELARERKLVIRVVSREATTAPRKLCDRVRKDLNTTSWKLAGDAPVTELAQVLEARPLDAGGMEPRVVNAEPPAFAGMQNIEPIVGPPAPVEIPVIVEAEPQPVYVVQAKLDATTMSQLRATLEKSVSDEVVFEERYEPLPLSAAGAPVLTPAAVLWWTNPPSGWTSWGEVPVVIEPK